MKKSNIYTGTIKYCKHLELYKKYGEKRYIVSINKEDYFRNYSNLYKENAILIKVKEDTYICLEDLESIKNKILYILKIYTNTLNTYPTNKNSLYIDEDSIKPIFDYKDNKKINLKKLKNT